MSEPEPIISLTADRTVIAPGEPVTIRWHVEGVKEVYFFTHGEDWVGHGVAGVDAGGAWAAREDHRGPLPLRCRTRGCGNDGGGHCRMDTAGRAGRQHLRR